MIDNNLITMRIPSQDNRVCGDVTEIITRLVNVRKCEIVVCSTHAHGKKMRETFKISSILISAH